MKKYKTIFLYVIIALLCISTIHSYKKIAKLENDIARIIQDSQTNFSIWRTELNHIYNNVDDKLEKEASILSVLDVKYGEVDTEHHTVMIELEVLPKELSDLTKLTLTYKDKTYNFIRNGDIFKTSFPAYLFNDYNSNDYVYVKIDNGGLTKTQQLDRVNLTALYDYYLPHFYAPYAYQVQKKKDKININIDESIGISIENEKMVKFDKLYFISTINGESKREYITTAKQSSDFYEGQEFWIGKKMVLDVNEDDEVVLSLEAVDELGYIHQVQLYEYKDGRENYVSGYELILDKNGNQLTIR